MPDRRQILAAALVTPAVALLSASPTIFSTTNPASWRAFGEAVARALGPASTARLLAAERGRVETASDPARQSSDDYRAGRTVMVEGVMISRTEATLGLLALERAGRPA